MGNLDEEPTSFVGICRNLGLPTSGTPYSQWSKGVNDLVTEGWISKDNKSGLTSIVRQKVEKALDPYNPTPEEIDQVFNHLVLQLAEVD